MLFKTTIEPFRIKSVEPITLTTRSERAQFIEEAHYNPFLLDAESVMIDLLTDSGTSAMSSHQWGAIMVGDESYAGAKSWKKLYAEIHDLTGFEFILPTHQGRAAEKILYSQIGGPGKTFISNTHFDTTRANIEYSGATAIDIPCSESFNNESNFPFKGNMDVAQLTEKITAYGAANIAAVILTVTNNSGGGQAVSMENAMAVSEVCKKFKILLIIDCCRIAENAFFIKHHEAGYGDKDYRAIAQQMFQLADGCVMSAKKDALVNIGGFLALKDEALAAACTSALIITEGFATYGGLAGRDMEAIAVGLREVFDASYLNYRIKSTAYLGIKLKEKGVPVIWPIGGHAVYINAGELYPHIPSHQYPGQALVNALYVEAGIRAVEIGSVMFGKYDAEQRLIPASRELVRLAIPRRVYTQSHIEYVIEAFDIILNNSASTKGFKIVKEPEFLRHFTAHFQPLE